MKRNDGDDIDWPTVLSEMRDAAARSRGYAGFWEWAPDKTQAEVGVASTLADHLSSVEGTSWATGKVLSPSDPPDVLFIATDGRRVGIEVTELVSPEAAAFHRHRKKTGQGDPYAFALWTAETVAAALVRATESKDRKLGGRRGDFDELLLAVATDEPMITLELAEEALCRCAPAAQFLDRAFLLLSYGGPDVKDRFPDGYPVLPITLQRE